MDTLESVKVLRINFMMLLKTIPLVSQYTMVAAVCRVEVYVPVGYVVMVRALLLC